MQWVDTVSSAGSLVQLADPGEELTVVMQNRIHTKVCMFVMTMCRCQYNTPACSLSSLRVTNQPSAGVQHLQLAPHCNRGTPTA